jgi:hypothetical protein
MVKRIVLSIAFWATALSAHAEGGNYWLMWSPDCAQWLQYRQTKQSEMHEAYVVGLINGMSMGSGVSIWSETGKPTKEQLFYWLDEYCRNNPLKDTSEAAAAFANQVTHDAYLHALMRHHATD